jgi:hypothetical protein
MTDKISFHSLSAIEARLKEYEEAFAKLTKPAANEMDFDVLSRYSNLQFAIHQMKEDIARFGPTRCLSIIKHETPTKT